MPLNHKMVKILQVLGSIIYAPIAAAIVILISAYPFFWILEANTFWSIVLFLTWGFVQMIATLILVAVATPFVFLTEDNVVATIISFIIMVVTAIYYIIVLWRLSIGNGFGLILMAILVTGALIRNFIAVIVGILGDNGNL